MKSDQDECVLCCGEISIYAIGECDHPVCYQCSARMRVLCETNECPICRSDMPWVIWTYKVDSFSTAYEYRSETNKRYQIAFENESALKAFNTLLLNNCAVCKEEFLNFTKLAEHVRRKHDLHYCDLCTENLKVFPFERKTYNRKDLARHKRIGDPDDTSHRGHPICEFCDQRYIDIDELYRHLRREHYYCHFCDADGNHEYYEDYDYLRVHFRKDHFLCEEGECVNEQFIGAFRSDIDLKAHIAIHHSKNKSKAEARQARMLDVDFQYAPSRPTGSSSPRSGRYQRRHNIDESKDSSKHLKEPVQQSEAEKINTTCTLEFPFLSEEGDNRSNNVPAVPTPHFNSVAVHSTGRKPSAPQKNNKIFSDDFPALRSAATSNVSSEATSWQKEKSNSSENSAIIKNKNVSVKLSQPKTNSQAVENKHSAWISRKTTFEDNFPKLEPKKPVGTNSNLVNKTAINTRAEKAKQNVTSVPISTHVSNGDQFVTIKAKSKKKHRAGASNNKIDNKDENEDDFSNLPNFLLTNSFGALNQENEDPFRRNLVRTEGSSRNNYVEERTWHEKVSFGSEDFPPLGATKVNRKPPGLNIPNKKPPPPGFDISTNRNTDASSLNITLSAIAQQLASNKNEDEEVLLSNYTFKSPPDFNVRSENLVQKIKALSVYEEFKIVSGQFIKNEISAARYYKKCLDILGDKGFSEIFPELIVLLPNINKQQELLDVHKKNQNHKGAVPKHKSLNYNQIAVCHICYQVLMEKDFSAHLHD